MSSQRYAVPLRLELRPSRLLAAFVLLSHGGALALLPIVPLPGWVRGGLALLVVASVVHALRGPALLRDGRAVRALLWDAEDRWTLYTRDGRALVGQLLPISFVHHRLVVLNFALGRWHRRAVVLAPDALDPHSLRRLRVRLRTEASSSAAQG